ncbi:hypothetical protein TI39_contig50g00004 [Zymoseptoria brevis]|uniref:Uncharacterized protein n=1 Tax=Zymoseptoria brevis TaxID=1047168 RepID=A0A0F4GYF3_9PEZI|nr:hypothetical protein TI39_contig50g00004 [Zymoseptoria brevis]
MSSAEDEHPDGLANRIEGRSRASGVRTLSPIDASALGWRRAPATNPAVLPHHKAKISSHLGHTKHFLVTPKPPEHTTFDQDVQNVLEHSMRGGSGEGPRPAGRMKLYRAPLPEQNNREISLAHDFDAVAATKYVPQQHLTQIAQTQAQRRHNALERQGLDEEDCAASIAAIKAAEIDADERRLATVKDARDAVQQSLDKALAQQLKRKKSDVYTIGRRQQQALGRAARSEKPRGFAVPATDFKPPFQEVQGQSPASEQSVSGFERGAAAHARISSITPVQANSKSLRPQDGRSMPASVRGASLTNGPTRRRHRAGAKVRARKEGKDFQAWAMSQGMPSGFTNEERFAMIDDSWDPTLQLFLLAWRRQVALRNLTGENPVLTHAGSGSAAVQANLNRLTAEYQHWDGLFAAKFAAWRLWQATPGT